MSEKHSLKGTRYERMEEEVKRMIHGNNKRPHSSRDEADGDDHHHRNDRKKFDSSRKKMRSDGEGTLAKAAATLKKQQYSTSVALSSSSNKKKQNDEKDQPVRSAARAKVEPTIPEVVPESAQSYTNDKTVYIQGLPFTCTEEEVRTFFKDVGEIVSIRLPRWHDSNKLKGYGHVQFATASAAKKGLDLSGSYIQDRFITVDRPMVPRALAENAVVQQTTDKSASIADKPPGCRTIFIKNLPYEVTEAEIREHFMVYGPILTVRLAVWNHTNNLKGFGYIDFKREDSADIAVKKAGSITIRDRVISVDFEGGAPKRGYKGLPTGQDKGKKK